MTITPFPGQRASRELFQVYLHYRNNPTPKEFEVTVEANEHKEINEASVLMKIFRRTDINFKGVESITVLNRMGGVRYNFQPDFPRDYDELSKSPADQDFAVRQY